jgi:hypothetical protein
MFDERRIVVPGGERHDGGWGGRLVPDGSGAVLTTLPSSANDAPLVLIDVLDDRVEPHGVVDGDLRDGCRDDEGRLWLLSTHGLSVFDRATGDRVGVIKEGLGTYKWDLVPLGGGLLGVSGWSSKSTTLVSTDEMRVRKRLRFPAPDLAVSHGAGEVTLYSFHAGTRATLDHRTLRTTDAHELPTGVGPVLVGRTIHVALGRRRRADRRIPASQLWKLHATRLAELDVHGLTQGRRARAPRRFRRVLGADRRGRLIAQTARTIRLLDPETYRTLATWTPTDGAVTELWSACHLAPHDAVAVRPSQFWVPELTVLTW